MQTRAHEARMGKGDAAPWFFLAERRGDVANPGTARPTECPNGRVKLLWLPIPL
jgi:hypothetical protein